LRLLFLVRGFVASFNLFVERFSNLSQLFVSLFLFL
jgi:hypothetical protein